MNPQNYLIPMVETYCDWLNAWIEVDEHSTHRYELHQFLVTDHDKDLYGSGEVIAVVPNAGSASSAAPRYMVVARITDGDEGGWTDLTAWFEIQEDNKSVLYSMIQGFDTDMQFIHNDYRPVNLPQG